MLQNEVTEFVTTRRYGSTITDQKTRATVEKLKSCILGSRNVQEM